MPIDPNRVAVRPEPLAAPRSDRAHEGGRAPVTSESRPSDEAPRPSAGDRSEVPPARRVERLQAAERLRAAGGQAAVVQAAAKALDAGRAHLDHLDTLAAEVQRGGSVDTRALDDVLGHLSVGPFEPALRALFGDEGEHDAAEPPLPPPDPERAEPQSTLALTVRVEETDARSEARTAEKARRAEIAGRARKLLGQGEGGLLSPEGVDLSSPEAAEGTRRIIAQAVAEAVHLRARLGASEASAAAEARTQTERLAGEGAERLADEAADAVAEGVARATIADPRQALATQPHVTVETAQHLLG